MPREKTHRTSRTKQSVEFCPKVLSRIEIYIERGNEERNSQQSTICKHTTCVDRFDRRDRDTNWQNVRGLKAEHENLC